MTYYTVSKPSTTYYTSSIFGLRTWKSLGDIPARTWAKLKELNLMTWERLGKARGVATFFYLVSNPTTTYYEVSV